MGLCCSVDFLRDCFSFTAALVKFCSSQLSLTHREASVSLFKIGVWTSHCCSFPGLACPKTFVFNSNVSREHVLYLSIVGPPILFCSICCIEYCFSDRSRTGVLAIIFFYAIWEFIALSRDNRLVLKAKGCFLLLGLLMIRAPKYQYE